jgi:putative hydrolase of the HAD superfamily
MLQEPTELLDGVRETLLEVSRRHAIVLITKGDLFDQESKLARSGLGELFQGVEILSEKTKDSYAQVLARRGIAPAEFVMVGNSLRSDIVPVVELGGAAVHIPYHLTWRHEHVDDDDLPPHGWHRLEGIRGLAGLLATLNRGEPRAKVQELQSPADRKRKRAPGPR